MVPAVALWAAGIAVGVWALRVVGTVLKVNVRVTRPAGKAALSGIDSYGGQVAIYDPENLNASVTADLADVVDVEDYR